MMSLSKRDRREDIISELLNSSQNSPDPLASLSGLQPSELNASVRLPQTQTRKPRLCVPLPGYLWYSVLICRSGLCSHPRGSVNSTPLRPEQKGPLPRPTSAFLRVCVLPCQTLGTWAPVPAEASSWLHPPEYGLCHQAQGKGSVDRAWTCGLAGPHMCTQSPCVVGWSWGRKRRQTGGQLSPPPPPSHSPPRHHVPVQNPRNPRVLNSNLAFQVVVKYIYQSGRAEHK